MITWCLVKKWRLLPHKIPGFPDFGAIQPRDGSIEIAQDYIYYPGNFLIMPVSQGMSVIRLRRPDPEDQSKSLPLVLPPGASLRIPLITGGYCVRDVKKVVGSFVELKDALNSDPIPGHQARRIQAYSQAYIDMRIRDLFEKGKLRVGAGRFLEV